MSSLKFIRFCGSRVLFSFTGLALLSCSNLSSDLSQASQAGKVLESFLFDLSAERSGAPALEPGQFLGRRPLPTLFGKAHFYIEFEWATVELREHRDRTQRPFISLHTFTNGFFSRDGIEIKLGQSGADLTVEIWSYGVRQPFNGKIEDYFSRRSRARLNLEVHNQPSGPSLSRVVVWTDKLDPQTGEARLNTFLTEDLASLDLAKTNFLLGRGLGVSWGAEFFKLRYLKVERRSTWL